MSGTNSPQMSAAQSNANARALVLANAVTMTQAIYTNTFVPATVGGVLNIAPRNVGLIKGFWIKCLATVNNTGTVPITPTTLNVANFLSQIVFTDLNNYTRLNTTGWHLRIVTSAKAKRPFGSALVTDAPDGFGSGYAPDVCPATIASGSTGQIEMWYYLPLAYHNRDLRGAIYANVLNATMNLQLTVNPNVCAVAGTDATLYMFTGAAGAAASLSSCTIKVYQSFLDQLPVGKSGVILPYQDLSTIYELKTTSLNGLTVGQDFPLPYANFRNFLSTTVIYDNGGTLNYGTDINYVALQSANFSNLFQVEPQLLAIWARNMLQVDVPKGMFYIDHREKPITTQQYGNMELIVNPSTVNTGAVLLVGYEDMGTTSTIIPAGSLPGG